MNALRGRRGGMYDVVFYVPSVTARLIEEQAPASGGAETQIFLVARGLAARGFHVCLFAYEVPGTELPAELDGITIVPRPPHRGGRGALSSIAEVAATLRALFSVDGVVFVTRIAGPHVGLVALVAHLRRRRFVFSSANLPDLDTAPPGLVGLGRTLHRLGLRIADAIIVQTNDQVERSQILGHRGVRMIPNACEVGKNPLGAAEAFLWVGRTAWYKRPSLYVDLARELPEARFWMIAAPAATQEDVSADLKRTAAGVANLDLLPVLPRSELLALIARAVAVVNTADFEGMPNLTLEGWSLGVPALTFAYDPDALIRREGLGEFAGGSWDAFVAAARRLWGSGRGDRSELAARCTAYVRAQHDPEAVIDKWVQVLGPKQTLLTVPALKEAV